MRIGLVVAAVLVTATTASAGPATPAPGTVGLTRREIPLRDACASSWVKYAVKKRGDETKLVAALTWPRITGLDFDPGRKGRAQASLKKFETWFRGLDQAYRDAAAVQTAIITDTAATPTAKVEAVARIVLLTDQMAGVIRASEHPRNIRAYPEAVEVFCDTLDEKIQPIEEQAKQARDKCNQIIAGGATGAGWWTAVCATP